MLPTGKIYIPSVIIFMIVRQWKVLFETCLLLVTGLQVEKQIMDLFSAQTNIEAGYGDEPDFQAEESAMPPMPEEATMGETTHTFEPMERPELETETHTVHFPTNKMHMVNHTGAPGDATVNAAEDIAGKSNIYPISVEVTHAINPTHYTVGVRFKDADTDKDLVKNTENWKVNGKNEKFAVIMPPNMTQPPLGQKLKLAHLDDPEQARKNAKVRGTYGITCADDLYKHVGSYNYDGQQGYFAPVTTKDDKRGVVAGLLEKHHEEIQGLHTKELLQAAKRADPPGWEGHDVYEVNQDTIHQLIGCVNDSLFEGQGISNIKAEYHALGKGPTHMHSDITSDHTCDVNIGLKITTNPFYVPEEVDEEWFRQQFLTIVIIISNTTLNQIFPTFISYIIRRLLKLYPF